MVHQLQAQRGHRARHGHREPTAAQQELRQRPSERRERPGEDGLGAHRFGTHDAGGPQDVHLHVGVRRGLGGQVLLGLGLLAGVEEAVARHQRLVLVHPDRVLPSEAVRRDRRRVHEPPGTDRDGGPEGVDGAVDVDRPVVRRVGVAGDRGRQVDDHVGTGDGVDQALLVLHVTAFVPGGDLSLRGVGRGSPAGHPDHLHDPFVGFEQGEEGATEGPGGARDGDGQG